jgi:hypothetical protein
MIRFLKKTYLFKQENYKNIKNFYKTPARIFTYYTLPDKNQHEDLIKILPIIKFTICTKCYGSGVVHCIRCNRYSKILPSILPASKYLYEKECGYCMDGVVPCDKCNAFQEVYFL